MTLILALWAALQAPDVVAGIAALDAGKFEEAERLFERAVAADTDDYAARFYLALAQTFLNKDEAAMAGFARVLQMKPGLFEAQVNLGLLQYRHRRFREAIATLEDARRSKPDDVRTVYHLADAYRESGDCRAAEPLFRRAMELDATFVAARLGLARCRVARGALEEAAPLLIANGAALELAQAYEDAGQADKAVPIYEESLQREASPEVAARLAHIRLHRGRVLRDQKNYAAAAQEFAQAARLPPAETEALNELAGVLILAGDDARALAVLDRLKSLDKETPAHLYFRALLFDRNRQPKPALAAYQAFLAAANGKYPDEEFKARQRARILEKEVRR